MPHGDLQPVEAPGNERLVILSGIVTTSTSGTIASQDCVGCTVAKTGSEAGRYTVTPHNKFLKLMYGHCVAELSADTAAVQAKGVVGAVRGVAAATPVLYLQFTIVPTAAAAGADAEVEDAAVIRFMLVMSRGKA